MRLSLAFALILIYSSLESQNNNCSHQEYKIFDTVYVWKHNGIDLLSNPDQKAKIISKVAYSERVIILNPLNVQNPNYVCYTDTILKNPLIMASSPYIKVIHNKDTGYVMENFLDIKRPFSIYSEQVISFCDGKNWLIRSDFTKEHNTIYKERWRKTGHAGEDVFSKEIFNNGTSVIDEHTHGMSKTKTIIPSLSRINYNLIASKCISDYQAKPEIEFSYELIEGIYHLSWKGIYDGSMGSMHGAKYYHNEYGMIIEYWNDSH